MHTNCVSLPPAAGLFYTAMAIIKHRLFDIFGIDSVDRILYV